MARMPEITSKADLPAEKQHVFDAIAQGRGRVVNPFTLLLNSPDAAERITHLGTYLRFESPIPPGNKQIAILAAAREFDCEIQWSDHTKVALKNGVREEVFDVIGHRRPLDLLTKEEALIVAYARELLRDHRVSEATFQAVRARYGNAGLTDLTAIIGYYVMWACVLNAFEVEAPTDGLHLP